MDEETRRYYEASAAEFAERHATAASGGGIDRYFCQAFAPGMRVLDVGAGVGRDMVRLLSLGIDAFGVEPSAALRRHALRRYPVLAGRLEAGELPHLGRPFGGVLCAAVPEAAAALRDVLQADGRLLLSVPLSRPGLDRRHRDRHGRLLTPLAEDDLERLFGRLGFRLSGKWHAADGLGREGYSWCTLLLQKSAAAPPSRS